MCEQSRWRRGEGRALRLCESIGLGERRFVALVQCEQDRFLIGGTGNSIALLAKLESAKSHNENRGMGGEGNRGTCGPALFI